MSWLYLFHNFSFTNKMYPTSLHVHRKYFIPSTCSVGIKTEHSGMYLVLAVLSSSCSLRMLKQQDIVYVFNLPCYILTTRGICWVFFQIGNATFRGNCEQLCLRWCRKIIKNFVSAKNTMTCSLNGWCHDVSSSVSISCVSCRLNASRQRAGNTWKRYHSVTMSGTRKI